MFSINHLSNTCIVGTSSQAANQIQLNMQPSSINQSPLATQRLQQASQSQSASQRLKQLGIHTSIASRNNTPTASPVTSQPPIGKCLIIVLYFSTPKQIIPCLKY